VENSAAGLGMRAVTPSDPRHGRSSGAPPDLGQPCADRGKPSAQPCCRQPPL